MPSKVAEARPRSQMSLPGLPTILVRGLLALLIVKMLTSNRSGTAAKGGMFSSQFWVWLAMGLVVLFCLLSMLLQRRPAREGSTNLRVAFVHSDLGIGGAERLIVDAAIALQQAGHFVRIFTARHEPPHCFEETMNGTLKVAVYGDFLPRMILGRLYAACAYMRMCWVSMRVVFMQQQCPFDVIIVDQVSICLPILRLAKARGIIFYCHYPDKLLTGRETLLKSLYRAPLDVLEELTTGMADKVFVNSRFTAGVFSDSFQFIRALGVVPSVLYPALNLEDQDRAQAAAKAEDVPSCLKKGEQLLLSINRFERKKNVGLAVRALAALPKDLRQKARLVLAGGYDEHLPENVEYAAELEQLAKELGVADRVTEMRSISGVQKANLLRNSACLLYTPDREHLGIVPLEAMYARVPVIAVNTGGPLETVAEGDTGYLRDPEPKEWAEAIRKILGSEDLRRKMGEAGRKRVADKFSLKAFGATLDSACRKLAGGGALAAERERLAEKADGRKRH